MKALTELRPTIDRSSGWDETPLGVCLATAINLKDFPAATLRPYGIEAVHPDDFLIHQIDLAPGLVAAAIKMHRASLRNPPKTVDEYIETLELEQLPKTAIRLRGFTRLS